MWLGTTKKVSKRCFWLQEKHPFPSSQLKQKMTSIINGTKGHIFRNKENVIIAQKQKRPPKKWLFFTIWKEVTFEIKWKEELFWNRRLGKLFCLLLATHLCEVCVQCLLVLYASVHEVCANIYIYIYNANTQNSNIDLYLNFLLQLGLSLILRYIPSQTPVVMRPATGQKKPHRLFLAGQRVGYLHQYLYISQWTHAISLSAAIPVLQNIVIQNAMG